MRNLKWMHFVYIMASRPGGALYVGETGNLARRVEQHCSGIGSVHTAKYKNRTLVWYRMFDTRSEVRAFERRLKHWRRAWKDALITEDNPNWKNLSATLINL